MLDDETMWSPAPAMLRTAYVVAAEPDATKSDAVPPSRAVMRFSATSWVGFMMRV